MSYSKLLIDDRNLKDFIKQHITKSYSDNQEYLQLYLSVYDVYIVSVNIIK